MILDAEDTNVRLESPLNLINRMKFLGTQKEKSLEIFGIKEDKLENESPLMPPSADKLILDLESKLKLGTAHDKAVDVLHDSVVMLHANLHNVDKIDKLSRIATDMGKVIANIDEIRQGRKTNAPVIIFKPITVTENHYESVSASD